MQTKEERLALIKAAAEKIQGKKTFKAKAKKSATKARVAAVKRRSQEDRALDREIEKLDENHNLWTDASSYAKEYYGDVAYETTRFDNDWN